MANFTASLGLDEIRIRFAPKDIAGGSIEFTKAELLRFVQLLGHAHQMLATDESPPPADTAVDLDNPIESSWWLRVSASKKRATIFFLHPAFGPMGFRVSEEMAMEMTQLLSGRPPPR